MNQLTSIIHYAYNSGSNKKSRTIHGWLNQNSATEYAFAELSVDFFFHLLRIYFLTYCCEFNLKLENKNLKN